MEIKNVIQDMRIQATRVNLRFSKIPRFYYWFFGGVLPALFFVNIEYSEHQFVVNASGLLLPFALAVITGVWSIVFASLSVTAILFGIMISLVIKDSEEKKKKQIKEAVIEILTSKDSVADNTDNQIVNYHELKAVMKEVLQKIWKEEKINLNKNATKALTESNRSYQNQQKLIEKMTDDIQSLTANIDQLKEEIKRLKG
jgi:uncharacterized protein (DUF3084 family)